MEDNCTDQGSRWTSETNNPPQVSCSYFTYFVLLIEFRCVELLNLDLIIGTNKGFKVMKFLEEKLFSVKYRIDFGEILFDNRMLPSFEFGITRRV